MLTPNPYVTPNPYPARLPVGGNVQNEVPVPPNRREVRPQEDVHRLGRFSRVVEPTGPNGRVALSWDVVGGALLPLGRVARFEGGNTNLDLFKRRNCR